MHFPRNVQIPVVDRSFLLDVLQDLTTAPSSCLTFFVNERPHPGNGPTWDIRELEFELISVRSAFLIELSTVGSIPGFVVRCFFL